MAILTFEVIEVQRRVRRLVLTVEREKRFVRADPNVEVPGLSRCAGLFLAWRMMARTASG